MAKQVMPQAQLETRASDLRVPDEVLLNVSLFAQLKRKPSLDKFPGSLVLRRFRAGEVICHQGEPSRTAYYFLTSEDVYDLMKTMVEATPDGPDKERWQSMRLDQAHRLAQLRQEPENRELRRMATAHLTVGRSARRKRGWLQWLSVWWRGQSDPAADLGPGSIRIDAPTAIDYKTMQAGLYEGEVFGQQNCRSGTPRSVTLVAVRDCVLLEMLRNIFDQVQKDLAYKERTDLAYKQRVLEFEVRKLSILARLTDAQFALIRDQLELATIDPGQVIYDEYERADSLYIIRSGMVKVQKKASALLSIDQVRNWPGLCTALFTGQNQSGKPPQYLWRHLSEPARAACLAGSESPAIPEADQREIVRALNEIIKSRALSQQVEFLRIQESPEFRTRAVGLSPHLKDWSDQDHRRAGRIMLDLVLDGLVRPYRRRVGPDCVLFYCSPGEFFGEMSVLGETERSETCVAQGQPKDVGTARDAGPVELVRIPARVLIDLLEVCPSIHRRLHRTMSERRMQAQEQVLAPVWDDSRQVLLSERFQQLGLIQGQKLMLIDLDRCTRCDECVHACAATHDDGQARLFLDGPRFGKYLIPTTCRSCLDPVCMSGCPVAAIHRGSNGQIVIEDWCIGCGLCSQQCPYGAIQMHDIGIIPENAHGWRYLPAAAVGTADWKNQRYCDRHWIEGAGPFINDRIFRDSLAPYLPPETASPGQTTAALADIDLGELMKSGTGSRPGRTFQAVCFRYSCRLSTEQIRHCKLTVISDDPRIEVIVNGEAMTPGEGKGNKREFWLGPAGVSVPASRTRPLLRAGVNLMAFQTSGDFKPGATVLSIRLDEVRKPTVGPGVSEEVIEKQVTHRAVACDLCSTLLGRVPACVNACPHDAAIRIDARSNFPTS